MILQLISTFLVSIVLSFFVIMLTKKVFIKLNILDKPEKYWHKRKPIPHSMWVIFVFVFFVISFFFVPHNTKLYLIWIFGFLITFVSFIDDFFFLSPKLRLFIQIIIASIIWITSIKIWYISNIFGGVIDLDKFFIEIWNYKIYIVSLIFTIIWYVFIFNSLNWTDWIVWNTAWLSIISFIIIFLLWVKLYFTDEYIWWIENAKFIMTLSIILVWIILPFWVFNVREKFLMWDSGTMFLGFMLATLAIISGWKIATVLVVFWIYSVDAVYVIINRIKNKKSPLSWDYTHLHHRLLNLWLSKKQVLTFIYIFSFLFWISSLFLDKTWKIIVFVIIIFFVIFSPKLISKFIKNAEK